MTGIFTLEGQTFYCMDAGPAADFTMALSLMVNCKTQKKVDAFYDKLSKGGEKQPCGRVKDKFGVSWQIVPEILLKLMGDRNKAKAGRVMQAMMQMHKIDIGKLKKAYAVKYRIDMECRPALGAGRSCLPDDWMHWYRDLFQPEMAEYDLFPAGCAPWLHPE